MRGKLIELMTWDEFREANKHVKAVIIPLGASTKEHGLHLPLNTDLILANWLRDRLAENLDDILLHTTIPFNYYPSFTAYPGTISLSLSTSIALVNEVCRNIARDGCHKIYILNTGISTLEVLQTVQKDLERDDIAMEYLNLKDFFLQTSVKPQQVRGTHADELETSIMLHIAPHIVDMSKASKDDSEELVPGPLTWTNSKPRKGVFSPSGVWGDATLATAEKGKQIANELVDYVIMQIKNFISSENRVEMTEQLTSNNPYLFLTK